MMKTRMQLALQNALAKHQNRESGQGLVEYALILVLVAVVVIVILSQLGPSISNIFNEINDALGGDFAKVMNYLNYALVILHHLPNITFSLLVLSLLPTQPTIQITIVRMGQPPRALQSFVPLCQKHKQI
jgi:pilus assembly protein Flp/PilA